MNTLTWKEHTAAMTVILSIVLAVAMVFSITIGRYPVSPSCILMTLVDLPTGGTHYDDPAWTTIVMLRLPRIFLVALCGMGLALSGASMQGVFRNPLIGPDAIGVMQGAAFGGVLALLFGWAPLGVVTSAFACGFAGLLLSLALARAVHRSGTLPLVLSGIITGSLFGSLVGLVQVAADPQTQLPSMIYWLLGSFAASTYLKTSIVAMALLLGGGTLLLLRWRINLFSLSDDDASALGINVNRIRWLVITCVVLIVAAQVAVSGGVGWIGLIVPHIARMFVGSEHSHLLPFSALLGGLCLLCMDDLARTLTVQEIPIGLLTGIIGAPAFAFLFWYSQSQENA
jgi:iron complex transport system permease protein